MRDWRRAATWLLAAAAAAAIPFQGGRAEEAPPLSPAQAALFDTDHLKGIDHPVVLEYAFRHRGGNADDYSDTIKADIRTVHDDGKKDVWVDFLSGQHKIDYPPAMGFHGNPLLMYFLEHDVGEMHERTQGPASYYRNRIREAFLDRAEVRPVTFTLAGAEKHGTEIVVAPFRGDPMIARFAAFAEKTYRFVLSDAVPGELFEISTAVPDDAARPPAFSESMTYVGEQP